MSELWARCNWLRSCLENFMRGHEREISVFVAECPPRELPLLWHCWEGWVDAPTPFTEAIGESLTSLRGAINAIRAIHAELDRPDWLSCELRDNFRTFFEEGFLKQNWLVGEGISDCGCDQRQDLGSGEMLEVHQWLLTTAPVPAPALERLCDMASQLLTEEERRGGPMTERRATRNKEGQKPDIPALTLGHKSGYVFALGKEVLIHTPEMFDLISAMVDAYPVGLTLDQVRKYHTKGNTRLKALVESDSHFAAAVALPGGPSKGGYRIRSVADASPRLTANSFLPPETKSDSAR